MNFSLQYCIVLFCSIVWYFPAARASFEIDVPPASRAKREEKALFRFGPLCDSMYDSVVHIRTTYIGNRYGSIIIDYGGSHFSNNLYIFLHFIILIAKLRSGILLTRTGNSLGEIPCQTGGYYNIEWFQTSRYNI